MAERAQGEARGNPAAPLKDVYSVALGIALVLAVEQILDVERDGAPFTFDLFPAFFAFVVTAFALYHWAIRVVDRGYVESSNSRSRRAIVTDLLVGSIEVLLLIALSILISRPGAFLVGLTGLLGFEVAAGAAFTHSDGYRGFEQFARRYWQVNLVAFLAGAIAIALLEVLSTGDEELVRGWIAFVIALSRTSTVYGLGFDFLFYGGAPGTTED